ncbi:hypothetical protein L7F22_017175 [Adiantum nelumboides]|nr:hypothetical protein [Adiantum nelumboides]
MSVKSSCRITGEDPSGLVTAQSLVSGLLVSNSGSGFGLVTSFSLLRQQFSGYWLVQVQVLDCFLVSFLVLVTGSELVWFSSSVQFWTGSGRSAGTQGSATQDPHIAASDSSSDFDVMEGYPMQQHPESSSQDMHALGQQPGISIFSRLKETLSRATRSKHATNEINEGGGEVDSPFTSQIDPVLSESAHVSTPTTTPIGFSKLTPSETLLLDDRSLEKVQEVERYILAAREKEIESLRKAEQRRATLAKAPMTSANPLQSPELTTLTSQPIASHIASGSKDTLNTSILDGVFLNENWEYNLQTEKLTDLYTSYTYHVGWLDVIQATSNSTSVDEQQRMICDVIHSIVQMERQNLKINMPSMGPMRFLDTTKAKQPTISQMETPSVTREALYLVDNCKAYGEVSEDAESIASGTSSVKSEISIKKDPSATPITEQMIEEITKRIQQQMKNPIMRNPDNKGKTTLNKVGVLPSASSGSETKPVVQINVVTRAQAKELEKDKPMEENAEIPVPTENRSLSIRTQRKSWKAKCERMKARRAESQTAIQEELQEVKQQLQHELESKRIEQNNQPRKAPSGGSVLVDKVLEPLDALLQQWEARPNNNKTLEQRWLTYPYPKIKTKRIEMCKDLIRTAQALMEPNVVRAPEQEVLIQKELEKQRGKEPEPEMGPKPDTNLTLEHRVVPNTTDEAMMMEVMPVPKVEDPWPQSLWETIRNRKDKSATLQSAPIPEVVLNNDFYPGDIQSLYGDTGTEVSMDSKPPSLKTLPSFIGKHEAKSEIRIVPSQQRATPKMIDSKELQEMLSTPVTCTITLSELLKIRPHLWEEMGKHLETKGIKIPIQTNPPREEKQNESQQQAQPVPINKVGDYCEGEESNTTGKAMLTDSDGTKVEVLITKDIINEALQFIPGVYDLIPKTKAIDNEKAFLKVKGSKFKYSDLIYSELELPLRLISQHLRVQEPPRYTEPFLHMAVVMALCVAEKRQVCCDLAKYILESLIE